MVHTNRDQSLAHYGLLCRMSNLGNEQLLEMRKMLLLDLELNRYMIIVGSSGIV